MYYIYINYKNGGSANCQFMQWQNIIALIKKEHQVIEKMSITFKEVELKK